MQLKKNTAHLLSEIEKALDDVVYGSVEIYVQNRTITQISVRNIKKTNLDMSANQDKDSSVL